MSQVIPKSIAESLRWLESQPVNEAQLAPQFVKLNRVLRDAQTPDVWEPAAQAMVQFLAELERQIGEERSHPTWSAHHSARVLSMLLTVIAEAGQYRFESFSPSSDADRARRALIDEAYLPLMGNLRRQAIALAKQYLELPVFHTLREDIDLEIDPLLDSMDPSVAPERYMSFRVIQVGNVVERLYGFRLRTSDPYLVGDGHTPGLLREIYDRKYLRFGTSGVRGRWGVDLTESRAKQVVQAICDFLRANDVPDYVGAEDLAGRRIVVGYDSRKHADTVARWVAEVCLANGFTVDFATRDTPTPALVYYLTDYLDPNEVAGLMNCTASHNPPEWHGIKFNPRLGWPAPTNVTDFIAARINEIQLLDESAATADIAEAEVRGLVRGFDPIASYTQWILASGNGNNRIPLDWDRIRRYFADKLVVVDEMHGAGRGYLTKLLGEIGVRHTVMHAERDPNIPGLDYANPEEPYIEGLKQRVRETNAAVGLGLDTDADRFGVVDRGGVYFRPNQILPMLVKYLGVDRKLTGRVIATQTGSPLIEAIAAQIPGNDEHKPAPGVLPSYVSHLFYRLRVGNLADRAYQHTFLVPVGIKYIEEQRRTDRSYRSLKQLPAGWRDTILIGGEESSGLTTRGHVPDKDGIWGDLLVLDMLAYYGTRPEKPLHSLAEIWKELTELPGLWPTYGGLEQRGSNTARRDIDAVLEAKEGLIDHYLDLFEGADPTTPKRLAGLEVVYLGGTRYDAVELQLRDSTGDDRHYLRIRASGTEPINRVYVESSDPAIGQQIMNEVTDTLERLSIEEIRRAHSLWRLADVLVVTPPTPNVVAAVRQVLAERTEWSEARLAEGLRRELPTLERRSQHIARAWLAELGG